jgi:hypothetical protein
MATGVAPNALALAAGAPKVENADAAAGAPPKAPPVEAPKPCTCTRARSPMKGGERKRLIEREGESGKRKRKRSTERFRKNDVSQYVMLTIWKTYIISYDD